MALSTTIVENGRGILIAGSGELTGGDIIAVKQALVADEEVARKLTFGLVTFVDVTRFRISVRRRTRARSIGSETGAVGAWSGRRRGCAERS